MLSIQERILEKSLDSETTDTEQELGEGEKAIVREMCNVSAQARMSVLREIHCSTFLPIQ